MKTIGKLLSKKYFLTSDKFEFISADINQIPGIISSACWQRHARSPQPHPTACCEPDSADYRCMDPGGQTIWLIGGKD